MDEIEQLKEKKICSIKGCDGEFLARGYCNRHYQKIIRKYKQKLRNEKCSVEDCERIDTIFYKKHNKYYCNKHYYRLKNNRFMNKRTVVCLENEKWKDIKDYELRYQISSFGRVKSKGGFRKNGRYLTFFDDKIMKPGKKKGNFYFIVSLQKNGKPRHFTVHRLVASHFLTNKKNSPQINHIDGDKLNNNVNNLEWCSSSHNIKHSILKGLLKIKKGEQIGNSKLKKEDIIFIRNNYSSSLESKRFLAEKYSISESHVLSIVGRRTWRHIP